MFFSIPRATLSCSFATRPPIISTSVSIFALVASSSIVSAPRVTTTKSMYLARSSNRGNLTLFHCRDAADLVRIIFGAVAYLHKCGIVHRDLKPENLLFKDPTEDADIMICDFGLSRVIESDKMALLTEICGTPGVSPHLRHPSGSLFNPP